MSVMPPAMIKCCHGTRSTPVDCFDMEQPPTDMIECSSMSLWSDYANLCAQGYLFLPTESLSMGVADQFIGEGGDIWFKIKQTLIIALFHYYIQ